MNKPSNYLLSKRVHSKKKKINKMSEIAKDERQKFKKVHHGQKWNKNYTNLFADIPSDNEKSFAGNLENLSVERRYNAH